MSRGPSSPRASDLDRAQCRFERMQTRHAFGVDFLERFLAERHERGAVVERFDMRIGGIFSA